MKTSLDPRHQKRRAAVKILFAESFCKQPKKNELVKSILKNRKEIDKKIQEAATAWPVDKLNKIDLAVLRLAIFELEKGIIPPKVVIDEAVELAKEFGSENSGSFVNGVLGTIYKEETAMNDIDEEEKLKIKIKQKLAEHIGVEIEDIKDEDTFVEDLHMNPAEITDFIHFLFQEGIEIPEADLTDMETVGDLIELTVSQPITKQI